MNEEITYAQIVDAGYIAQAAYSKGVADGIEQESKRLWTSRMEEMLDWLSDQSR